MVAPKKFPWGPLIGVGTSILGGLLGGGEEEGEFQQQEVLTPEQKALMEALSGYLGGQVPTGGREFPETDIPISSLEQSGMDLISQYIAGGPGGLGYDISRPPTTAGYGAGQPGLWSEQGLKDTQRGGGAVPTGPGVPGTVAAGQQAIQNILGLTTQEGAMGALGPTYDPATAAIIEALKGISPEVAEERFRTGTMPRAQRMFEETTLPAVREAFIGRGTFAGTGRQAAETQAGQQFGELMSQELINAIQQGRTAGLAALPAALGAAGMPLEARRLGAGALGPALAYGEFAEGLAPRRAEAAFRAGGVGREIQTQNLNRQLAKYAMLGDEEARTVQQIMQFLNIRPTQTTYQPGTQSPFWQIAGAIAPGLGSYFGGGGGGGGAGAGSGPGFKGYI